MYKLGQLVVFIFLCIVSVAQQKSVTILEVPGKQAFTQIKSDHFAVLPSGRYVQPAGEILRITHDPFGLAISPDGSTSVTIHDGVITVINNNNLNAVRIPSYDRKIKSPLKNGSFIGVAIAADNKTVYLSGGDNGAVIVYDIEKFVTLDSISLNGTINGVNYEDSYTSDLVLLNEHELLALDRGNFRLVRIDIPSKKITASMKSGRLPFGLALSPDKKFAFVANVGLYEYSLVKGTTKENLQKQMIPYHPYGNGTKEAIEGTTIEGKEIPGVGSPLHEDAMSVFSFDLSTNQLVKKYKTGYQIGEMVEEAEVVGGASPNSIAVGTKYAYITNASNDNIAVIDYRTNKIIDHIAVHFDPKMDKYRGLLPFGITLSKDEKTLYVALLGANAVAVIDVKSKQTKGLIPAGWGTSRVKLAPDEKNMYIISCRGLGAGPNGGKGFVKPIQGTYVGDIQLGTFQKMAIPDSLQLATYTQTVKASTFSVVNVKDDGVNPLPPLPGLRESPIKYIVYITKENRTYDEFFGQLAGGNGDSTLAKYGLHVAMADNTRVNVTPNHHKIAQQFAFSDNFYCDSDASIHGHHWMMGVIPNEWVETNSSSGASAKLFSNAPGRRYPGSTGSMDPEDYAEKGGLWEALERKKVSFYNFGEANETAHVREQWFDTATGAGHIVMVPMQDPLWKRTSHNYAGFNTNIPDQFRLDQFESEFTKMWLKGKSKMPQLVTIQLPNDHGAGIRPNDGYPYASSYMADNDLGLGRMLHFLSRTPYWKNMLVIVTEDDPQGGVDHIDAHRSILMMAGPYVKKGYVSHTHANFGSILKTIYNTLNVPYVNQYDVTASLLNDWFTPTPDFSPYNLVFPDKKIFETEKAMKKYNHTTDWKKILQGPAMDNSKEIKAAHYSNEQR